MYNLRTLLKDDERRSWVWAIGNLCIGGTDDWLGIWHYCNILGKGYGDSWAEHVLWIMLWLDHTLRQTSFATLTLGGLPYHQALSGTCRARRRNRRSNRNDSRTNFWFINRVGPQRRNQASETDPRTIVSYRDGERQQWVLNVVTISTQEYVLEHIGCVTIQGIMNNSNLLLMVIWTLLYFLPLVIWTLLCCIVVIYILCLYP